jgi:DNA replication protein DnaC
MDTPAIGSLLTPEGPENSSGNRCIVCKLRVKAKDPNGGFFKCCKRCLDVWIRKKELTPERAEKIIAEAVGERFIDAKKEDVEQPLREKLSALKSGQDVYLYGPTGVGKTHAMAALLRHYVYLGFECKRINFDDFCVRLRSSFSPAASQTEYEIIEPLKNVDKLFIDDLGLRSDPESNHRYDTLFSLLNNRQERMLPTFITTNKTIEQLGRSFDARITSRLKTALVYEMTGDDKRKVK